MTFNLFLVKHPYCLRKAQQAVSLSGWIQVEELGKKGGQVRGIKNCSQIDNFLWLHYSDIECRCVQMQLIRKQPGQVLWLSCHLANHIPFQSSWLSPGIESWHLFFLSNVLLMHLGGRRWWPKWLDSCHLQGSSRWNSWLLASIWPSPGCCCHLGVTQYMEDLSVTLPFKSK